MVRTDTAKSMTSVAVFLFPQTFIMTSVSTRMEQLMITLVALVTVHGNCGLRQNFCASSAGRKS